MIGQKALFSVLFPGGTFYSLTTNTWWAFMAGKMRPWLLEQDFTTDLYVEKSGYLIG